MAEPKLVSSDRKHLMGMQVPKGGSSCAKCRFLSGSRSCSLKAWVEAPKDEGGGGGDPELPHKADRFCCDGFEASDAEEKSNDSFRRWAKS